MKKFKLSINLLPKGAWGHDLSKTLAKSDWDALREACYKKADKRCEICGRETKELNAHEEWDFDIETKTQTLKDITALCSACHGVKHFRNSERTGYGGYAKAHFMKVNNCNTLTFSAHLSEAEALFEERNKVLRWRMTVNLNKFGGEGIVFKQKEIPLIENPYENTDWESSLSLNTPEYYTEKTEISEKDYLLLNVCPLPPKILSIKVNNYNGTISIKSSYTNNIQCLAGNEVIKSEYNIGGVFTAVFKAENLSAEAVRFCLNGSGGRAATKEFRLYRNV